MCLTHENPVCVRASVCCHGHRNMETTSAQFKDPSAAALDTDNAIKSKTRNKGKSVVYLSMVK